MDAEKLHLQTLDQPPAPPAPRETSAQPALDRTVIQNPKSKIQNLAVAGLLLALALLFMAPGLWPGNIAAPLDQLLIYLPWQYAHLDLHPHFAAGDPILQQLPWRHWMQQELAAGRFPLWAPGPLGGSPLFASYQPGVLYPLNLLWILLPIGAGLGLILAVKLWLTGLGMWGFLRALRLHPVAALLGAISLMFSASLVNLLPWQLTNIYLLLPWLAWAVYVWCGERRRGALVALAGLTACALLGGHPEELFMLGVTVALWALGVILTSPWRQWPRQILGLSGAAALGLALSAIQILPFIESYNLSHVALTRSPTAMPGANSRQGLDQLILWVFPRYWNYPPDGLVSGGETFTEVAGYVGLAPLLGVILAGVGLVRRQIAARWAAIWLVIGGILWLITYDEVVGGLIRRLPGFNQNVNLRFVAFLAFAVVVVSACGWDWLARRVAAGIPAGWRGGLLVGAGAVLLIEGLIVMGVHLAGWLPPPVLSEKISIWYVVNDSYRAYWLIWTVGVALAVLGALALWITLRRPAWLGPGLLAALMLADLWRVTMPINAAAPAAYYYPETSFLRQVRQVVPPTERILPVGQIMPANTGLVYGIRDWRSQDALLSERAYQAAALIDPTMSQSVWTEYNMFLEYARLGVASLLGMRYFIFTKDTDPNHPEKPDPDRPTFQRLAFTEGLGLWAAEGVPGFTYLSDKVQAVTGGKAALDWLQSRTWAQVRAYPAVVEAPAAAIAAIAPGPAGTSPGSTTVQRYLPGDIQIQTDATRPALLVVAESGAPGWQATLDGQPAPILVANYLSQGVVVPAGRHTVALHYQPASFTLGAGISTLALLVWLALALWARRGTRYEVRGTRYEV